MADTFDRVALFTRGALLVAIFALAVGLSLKDHIDGFGVDSVVCMVESVSKCSRGTRLLACLAFYECPLVLSRRKDHEQGYLQVRGCASLVVTGVINIDRFGAAMQCSVN